MPSRRVQIGQQWTKDGTGEMYLVTKLYTEALATFATLRKAGAETQAILRVKIERRGDVQTLPGFSLAQDPEEI